jgi:large subunit ribosomal protein L12
MEYVYAALMLHKLQKEVTEENVTSVVKATGAEVNEAQVKALVASLADVNIEEAIKAAPVAVAAAPAAAADAPAGGDEKKEAKPEPPSEKQEEQAMEGLASLFG